MSETATLSDRLRDAVAPAFVRAGSLPFVRALSGGSLPRERAVDQLRCLAIVTATIERSVARAASPAVLAAAAPDRPRLGLLLEDLDRLDRDGILPDDPGAAAQALALARRLVVAAAERPERLAGDLFALRSFEALLRAAAAGPQLGAAWYGAADGAAALAAFRERLDALESGGAARPGLADELLDAASETAEALLKVHAALDPATSPARRYLATTLNPEAGVHEVPSDPAILAASVRAGERCLAEYPYFVERWGERGRRWTRSDAGWLASLADLDAGLASVQAAWFAGVLARRGIPSLLLERQLLLLAEELSGAIAPETAGLFETAAGHLGARREGALPARHAAPLEERFVLRAGDGAEEARRTAARILLAAAADERAGFAGAVDSVASWFGGARFSEAWRDEVDLLLREALALPVAEEARGDARA